MGALLDLARVAVTGAVNAASAHYRWRVSYADGRCLEVCVLPELNYRDMLDRYAGATIEPLSESVP
jgi:hypothetical protein